MGFLLADEEVSINNPSDPTKNVTKLDIDYGEMKHLVDRHDDHASHCKESVTLSSDSSTSISIDDVRAKQVMRRMRVLTCVAAIGGFLSGYNTGVISGALLPLKRVFQLSAEQEEAIVSATIFAAFVASLVGGFINTHMGRKKSILLAAAIFTVGGAILFSAQNYATLVVGEIFLGIGIGMESLTSPMYISEVAKPSIRGMLVSAYALMMCFGQFSAGVVDGIFGAFDGGWRWMFGMACVPGAVMFVGFLALPESPSWLMSAGREEEAEEIMRTLRDSDEAAEDEIVNIREGILAASINAQEVSLSKLMANRPTRNALLVGCGVMVMQQICGVNGVLYYAASIYQMSGFKELTSIWLSAFTAFAQIIGLFVSVMLVETAGRRVLLISSFFMVGICSMGLGLAFYLARVDSTPVLPDFVDDECAHQAALVWDGVTRTCFDCTSIEGCGFCGGACVRGDPFGPNDTCPVNSEWQFDVCYNPYGWMSVLFMVTYLIVFGVGAAGLPWTVNSEIYPVKYRSLAVSISTGTNWLSNLLVSSTFLTINSPKVLTNYGSFWMYGFICFLGAAWLYVALPETKGLSPAEIEQSFSGPCCVWNQHDATKNSTSLPLSTHPAKPGYGSIDT